MNRRQPGSASIFRIFPSFRAVQLKAGCKPGSKRMSKPVQPRQDFDRDLGLGARVADVRGKRFLNHDGSFNVRRKGRSLLESLNFFHWLLNLSVGKFIALVAMIYLVTNSVFAAGYFLCGSDGF